MPLSAIVDGELLCAPLVPDDDWQALRGSPVSLQPCGHRGFPRVSPLGTRHFVHERDSDCHQPESPEHLHLKAVVAAAVAASGWQPGTEVCGPGFVADVLARRDGVEVAVEVQRSRQVLHRYRERQATYARAGIRAVWLVKSIPAGHLAGPDLPLFLVTDWLAAGRCVVMGRDVPVPDLVRALLSGACRWQPTVEARARSTERLRMVCPVCGQSREVAGQRWLEGTCRCGLPVVCPESRGSRPDGRCCGYWGPAVGVAVRRTRSRTGVEMPAGHWCLTG